MKTTSLRIATCALFLATTAWGAGDSHGTLPRPPTNASADLTLERIVTSEEFAARTVDAMQWLPDRSGFTVLEGTASPSVGQSSSRGDKPDKEKSQDNKEGYKNGSPITLAHRLQGHLPISRLTGWNLSACGPTNLCTLRPIAGGIETWLCVVVLCRLFTKVY